MRKDKNHNKNELITGTIYTELCNRWDELPREIFEQIEWKLKTILLQKKLVTVPFSKKMKKYIDGQKKALISIKEESKDSTNPPFTNYFVHPHGNEGFVLIAYNENCILKYETDSDYDFFFALKLIVLDLMKFDEFLAYHFTTNFKSDSKKYKSFLQILLVKYKQYFEKLPIAEIINKYIETELNQKTTNIESDNLAIGEINPSALKTEINEPATLIKKIETKKYPNIFAESVNPDHLTVKQASEFLNLAEQTIYGYTHRKQIPFYKPQKKLYFLKTELEEWLRQGKQGVKTKTIIQIKRKIRF